MEHLLIYKLDAHNRTYVTENLRSEHQDTLNASDTLNAQEDQTGQISDDAFYGVPDEYETNHALNVSDCMGISQEQKQFYAVLETLTVTEVLNMDIQPVKKFSMKDEVGITVLDTGCIKTVSGQRWFNAFVDTLKNDTRNMISAEPSSNIFKFGGGTRLKSLGMFSVQCSIAGRNIVLVTDIVDQSDLPYLLSKESMKKAGVCIDVGNDCIKIFGKQMKLETNRSGHYTLQLKDLIETKSSKTEEQKVLIQMLDGKDMDEDLKRLVKMHEGLGHP